MITQSCGMHASLLGAAPESYLIDNDMLGAIMRTVRGIEVNDDTLSVDTVTEVVNGEGHYLGHSQTLGAMTRDYLYPRLADRQSPGAWEEAGALDIRERARQEARRILRDHRADHFPQALDRRLRERFPIHLTLEAVRPR